MSYRTTAEITALANRVLRAAGAAEAQAFERHGRAPELAGMPDELALCQRIAAAARGARERGWASVAVLARTTARARELAEALARAGLAGATLIDRPEDVEYRGGVVVLPVHLAKGLEFDAAVVVDADARTYPKTDFDARLLYVALTRAMHEVHVLWQGSDADRTPLLGESE